MSFEISKWDGLAKIGRYIIGGKSFTTPALFPVVHPTFQDIAPARLQSEFGFDQLITSAYLLSKKFPERPNIHELLQTDAVIMMDSGAYQLMVYGDVELTPESTLDLQATVGAEIGVIMDHPIGYDVSYNEAKERVTTTITRVHEAMAYFESAVNWTLPIQGGKYLDLMEEYLDAVLTPEILNSYSFFALGSVVQIMIRQDYPTLVKMIITARKKLPVKYPLHLFGAGHPAMFALATFLGCDTFDSAAYSLMAKDGRYMTNTGTYELAELQELPCSCPICAQHSAASLRQLDKPKRRTLLAEHNLWVTIQEIRQIRVAINRGNLWDIVTARANAVPNLAKATRLAIRLLSEDVNLKKLYFAGIPVSKNFAIRIFNPIDVYKPEILMGQQRVLNALNKITADTITVLLLNWDESTYQRIPDAELKELPNEIVAGIINFIPAFGFVPQGLNQLYPFTQFISDLELEEYDKGHLTEQRKILVGRKVVMIAYDRWSDELISSYFADLKPEIIYSNKPIATLKKRFL